MLIFHFFNSSAWWWRVGNSRLLLAVVLILAILAIAQSRVIRHSVLEAIASVETEPEPWETPAELTALH
jgi:hypothetical protein